MLKKHSEAAKNVRASYLDRDIPTSGLMHAVYDIDGVPAMGGRHAGVRTAFKYRSVKISMFLAFLAPERGGGVE